MPLLGSGDEGPGTLWPPSQVAPWPPFWRMFPGLSEGTGGPDTSSAGLVTEGLISGCTSQLAWRGSLCMGSVAATSPCDNPPSRRGLPGGCIGSCSGHMVPRPSVRVTDGLETRNLRVVQIPDRWLTRRPCAPEDSVAEGGGVQVTPLSLGEPRTMLLLHCSGRGGGRGPASSTGVAICRNGLSCFFSEEAVEREKASEMRRQGLWPPRGS